MRDIGPSSGASPRFFVQSEGFLYFCANDAAHGAELWRTDGTEAGTALVRDIAPGVSGSDAVPHLDAGGTLYFLANFPMDLASSLVGDVQNPADGTGFGAVDQEYRLLSREVTSGNTSGS